jgi:signal transduction histidine kinase
MLRESKVKRIGHGPLPPPRLLSGADLLDARNDATRVRIECRLVNTSLQHGKPVWEFQVGTRSGTARLGFSPDDPPPVGSVVELTGVFAGTGGNRVTSQSVDSFELWLASPDDVVLRSQPPWWNFRRTMMVLGALLGVLGVTGVWIWLLRREVGERTAQLAAEIRERQRVEQQEAVERERARVAQDLHDELGAGLTEVGILGSLVKNPGISAEQKAGYLDQVINVSRGLVTALDEIVWAVNPRYDSLGALRGYFSLYAERFLELSGIRCLLPAGVQLPEHPLDSRTRHSLFLAFKEALVNVVKHAGATEVRLGVGVEGSTFLLRISDNGRGFAGDVDQPGMDGLRNMHERLRQLGGECRIESRAGQGTTVTFRLPLS